MYYHARIVPWLNYSEVISQLLKCCTCIDDQLNIIRYCNVKVFGDTVMRIESVLDDHILRAEVPSERECLAKVH